MEIRSFTNENETNSISSGQTTLDISVAVSKSLLIDLLPGETVFIETESLSLESTKISVTSNEECGNSLGSVIIFLSDQFLNQRSKNGTNFMDCSLLSAQLNL